MTEYTQIIPNAIRTRVTNSQPKIYAYHTTGKDELIQHFGYRKKINVFSNPELWEFTDEHGGKLNWKVETISVSTIRFDEEF